MVELKMKEKWLECYYLQI